MTSAAIQSIADAGQLEVERVEAKIPIDATGDTWTVSLGGYDLAGSSGSLSSRIDAAVEAMQSRFRLMAHAATNGAEVVQYQYLSAAPFRFYTVEVVGTLDSLSALTKRASVAAIFADPTSDKAIAFRGYLRDVRNALSNSAAAASKRDATTLKAITPITHCCGSPVPLPPPTVPPPIKDPVVDATMNGLYDLSGAPNASAAFNLFIACGRGTPLSSDRPELNCPNDYTYTPHTFAGDLDNWRVGIRNVGGTINLWQCYLVYNSGGNDGYGYYSWSCGYTTVSLPKRTIGAATAKIKWGSTTAWTGTQYRPISTLAFNASEMKPCYPDNTAALPSEPCPLSGPDAVFIKRTLSKPNVGYEDKILVPNTHCTRVPFRLSNPTDQNLGCFWHDSFYSNLPAYYVDTNWEDTADTYVASSGSADATQILPGKEYLWQINFSAGGWETVLGSPAKRRGSVMIRDNQAATCLTGLPSATDAPAGSPAACFYSVDSTKLTEDAIFTPH